MRERERESAPTTTTLLLPQLYAYLKNKLIKDKHELKEQKKNPKNQKKTQRRKSLASPLFFSAFRHALLPK